MISSGPLTSTLPFLKNAEKRGAAGASTKLTLRERPFRGKFRLVYIDGIGPMHASERRLDLDEGVSLVQKAKEETDLVIFANVTEETPKPEKWVSLAQKLEEAGADMIEANYGCPMIGFDEFSETGEENNFNDELAGGAVVGEMPELASQITEELSSSLSIPLVCKLTPTVSNMAEVAHSCEEAGADSIALFGGPSHALPPVDIEKKGKPLYPLVEGANYGFIAGPSVKHATYKRVAEISQAVDIPIIASGGISSWRDAIEMMMWGADIVSITSSLLREGWGVVNDIVEGIDKYLENHSYDSYEEIVGSSLEYLRPASQIEILEGYAEVDTEKCISCGECLKPAHCDAIEMVDGAAKVDRKKCIGCGLCQSICPVDAIDMKRR